MESNLSLSASEIEEYFEAVTREPERVFLSLGREKSGQLLKELIDARPECGELLRQSEFSALILSGKKTVIASIILQDETEDNV